MYMMNPDVMLRDSWLSGKSDPKMFQKKLMEELNITITSNLFK